MIMFKLVNRLLRSAMAMANRILEGLSFMAPNPAFCAASDMVSGEGDAENRADMAGDALKPADIGLTKFPIKLLAPGDANPPKLVPEKLPEKLARGEGEGTLNCLAP